MFLSDYRYRIAVFGQKLGRAVTGAIIHDDQFIMGVRLGEHGSHSRGHDLRPVVRGNDHTDERTVHDHLLHRVLVWCPANSLQISDLVWTRISVIARSYATK